MENITRINLTGLKSRLALDNNGQSRNIITPGVAVVRDTWPMLNSELMHVPFALDEMRLMVITRGWSNATVNLIDRHYTAGTLVYLGPNGISQLNEVSDDVDVFAVSISAQLMSLAVGSQLPPAFNGSQRDFTVQLTPDEIAYLDRLHALLSDNLQHGEPTDPATLHLLAAYLWTINDIWQQHETATSRSRSRDEQVFTRFLQLVNNHARREHGIEFYASELCLSPRYMSSIIKQQSGRGAKQWIDDAIIVAAKVALHHQTLTINQIADELNFPNPSFFCKFFKRLTGTTPMQYRHSFIR